LHGFFFLPFLAFSGVYPPGPFGIFLAFGRFSRFFLRFGQSFWIFSALWFFLKVSWLDRCPQFGFNKSQSFPSFHFALGAGRSLGFPFPQRDFLFTRHSKSYFNFFFFFVAFYELIQVPSALDFILSAT